MNERAAALALLLAGGAVAPAAFAKWETVRLQDTSFSVSWPKGRGAKWEFNGDKGSFTYKEKDEWGKPQVFRYSVRVVPFSPDEHWDSVLNKESGTDEGAIHVDEGQRAALPDVGGDRGAALIEGEIQKGVQATFPTRRWILAQRDGDGILRDFRDIFVLRAPAHYVSIRYDYTPPTAHDAGLAVFNRMVRSLGAFDRPRKGGRRGKKAKRKKGAAAAKPAAPKAAPPPAAPAPTAAPESAAPSASPGAPSMPAGPPGH